jgi:hypothetical protein
MVLSKPPHRAVLTGLNKWCKYWTKRLITGPCEPSNKPLINQVRFVDFICQSPNRRQGNGFQPLKFAFRQ